MPPNPFSPETFDFSVKRTASARSAHSTTKPSSPSPSSSSSTSSKPKATKSPKSPPKSPPKTPKSPPKSAPKTPAKKTARGGSSHESKVVDAAFRLREARKQPFNAVADAAIREDLVQNWDRIPVARRPIFLTEIHPFTRIDIERVLNSANHQMSATMTPEERDAIEMLTRLRHR